MSLNGLHKFGKACYDAMGYVPPPAPPENIVVRHGVFMGPPKPMQWPYGPMTLEQVLNDDIEAWFARNGRDPYQSRRREPTQWEREKVFAPGRGIQDGNGVFFK